MIHIPMALAIQLLVGLTTGNWWAGAFGASMLFIGREQAQAEYRWIEWFGDRLRKNLPWYGSLQSRVWDRHSLIGWIGPIVTTGALAALIGVL